MYENETRCTDQCLDVDNRYISGHLIIHKDVCPFQYFCKCACLDSCASQCASQGMINEDEGVNDVFGCKTCNCKCKEPNCWKTCNGSNFEVQNNTFGCSQCKCDCPDVDCDRKCSEGQVGILKINKEGCLVCDGCGNKKNNGTYIA